MKLLNQTPLSVAVIAGRTAWQSFHKGGNYIKQTNDITIEDFSFLERLFKKFKHLSVAEHIYFNVEIKCSPLELLTLQEHFIIDYKIMTRQRLLANVTFNLRTYFEWRDKKEYKWFFDRFNKISLSNSYSCLIKDKKYELEGISDAFDFELIEGNYIDILYIQNNDNDKNTFVTFRVKNITRALLHELVRHDEEMKPTVKSTRYTLKELKEEKPFKFSFTEMLYIKNNLDKLKKSKIYKRASKYVKFTNDVNVDIDIIKSLENLRKNIKKGIANDKTKYQLPEAYLTEGIFTTNLVNIKNLIELRTSKDALWEFQTIAKELEEQLKKLNIL